MVTFSRRYLTTPQVFFHGVTVKLVEQQDQRNLFDACMIYAWAYAVSGRQCRYRLCQL